MAGTTKKGVWDLQQVRDQNLEGTWSYEGEGQLFAWGLNTFGQLGQNDKIDRSSPVQIPGAQWNLVSSMREITGAKKTDNTLWMVGVGTCGQLGQNDTIDRSSPVQIPGTQWNEFKITHMSGASSPFNRHKVLSTKTDGTLWAWGRNYGGSFGLNDVVDRSSPTQIPGTQWNKIMGGSRYFSVTKTDGTLWVCGSNNNGQLGLNDLTYRSSPTQIPGTQWNGVLSGQDSIWATKTDGTLWGWGRNGRGQLGQNNVIEYSSPQQIPGTQWSISSNTYTSSETYSFIILKTDGTLWACGFNGSGRLGQNSTANRSSPVQIPGTQWKSISGGYNSMIAKKTDDTLWAWGANTNGEMGQSDTIPRSSPVQIPGTQWSQFSSGRTISGAIKTL